MLPDPSPVPSLAGARPTPPEPDLRKKEGFARPTVQLEQRARNVWAVAKAVIEEAILAAEGSPGYDGVRKKRFVTERALEFLRRAEEHYDRIPDGLEPLAFRAVEWALDWMIETVFRRLEIEGRVNVSPAV